MRVLLWAFATSAFALPGLWRRAPGLDIGIGIDIPLNNLQPGETYVYSTGYQFEITNGDYTTTILETVGPTERASSRLSSPTSSSFYQPQIPESPASSSPATRLSSPIGGTPTATLLPVSSQFLLSTNVPATISHPSQIYSLTSTEAFISSSEIPSYTRSFVTSQSYDISTTVLSGGTLLTTSSGSLLAPSRKASAIPSSSNLDSGRISLSTVMPMFSSTLSKSHTSFSSVSNQNSPRLSSTQSLSLKSPEPPSHSTSAQVPSSLVDPGVPTWSSIAHSSQSVPFATSQLPLFTSSAGPPTHSLFTLTLSTTTSLLQTSSSLPSDLSSTSLTSRTDYPTTVVVTSTSSSQPPPPSTSPPSSQIQIQALTYSPYNNDGSCKNAQEVLSDLGVIASKNIPRIRVYGTDCGSIETIGAAVIQYGLLLDQGFYIDATGVDSIDSGVQEFIEWAGADNWQRVYMILVGNESINDGYTDIDTLLSKIAAVKAQLQESGYDGPISTAEPPSTFINNPSLCTSSLLDFVGINAQPYFDQSTSASSAGTFVLTQVSQTQNACGGKTVYITETGYPSSGDVNGYNEPSKPNQMLAINAIQEATQGYATFFTMYNDLWKPPGPYNVEQSFGIIDFI